VVVGGVRSVLLAVRRQRPPLAQRARKKRGTRGHPPGTPGAPSSYGTVHRDVWAYTWAEMESGVYEKRVLPRKVRWLAVVTGCVVGIALLSFKWLAVCGIVLIAAAVVQPWMPRTGRWALSVVAPLLGIWIVPMGGLFLLGAVKGETLGLDIYSRGLAFAWMLSPLLLIWCNVALVVEARRVAKDEARSHAADSR
jgi:hypothetical protein